MGNCEDSKIVDLLGVGASYGTLEVEILDSMTDQCKKCIERSICDTANILGAKEFYNK